VLAVQEEDLIEVIKIFRDYSNIIAVTFFYEIYIDLTGHYQFT